MVVITDNRHYGDIANAIRDKLGVEDTYKPDEMADAIMDISGTEPEPPDDGKTRFYIELPDKHRLSVPVFFNQTVSGGVLVDMGDGSSPSTVGGTGIKSITHEYSAPGKYVVTLETLNGTMSFGGSSAYAAIGGGSRGYNNTLYKAVLGETVTLVHSSFYFNSGLKSIALPSSLTALGPRAFDNCRTLVSVLINEGPASIGDFCFTGCSSLRSISIPASVESIGNNAFNGCAFMREYVFYSTSVPNLVNASAFNGMPSDCQIFVPDESVDAYKTATNWVTYADYIYPMSERVIP